MDSGKEQTLLLMETDAPDARQQETERKERIAQRRKARRRAKRRKVLLTLLLLVLFAESAAGAGFFLRKRIHMADSLPAARSLTMEEQTGTPEEEKPPSAASAGEEVPPPLTPPTEETETETAEERTAEETETAEEAEAPPPEESPEEPEEAESPEEPEESDTEDARRIDRFVLRETANTVRLYPNPEPIPVEGGGETEAEQAADSSGSVPNPPAADAMPESKYVVLLDAESGEILAARESWQVVPPASMTKVLTLLVAAEHLGSLDRLDDLVAVSKEITDYCYIHNCSIAGFSPWEMVTVRDLLYGCILPSGADAALALTRYIAGSHEAFVELMNEKAEELGISQTAHFTNCIGLYDPDHACTVKDIAVIMHAAMKNPVCSAVLGRRIYQTSPTDEHPYGLSLSNLFLRRIEDRFTDSALRITGGKTGFVNQSGSCAVSYAVRDDGRRFICVTGNAPGSWRVIYDHTLLYQRYCAW